MCRSGLCLTLRCTHGHVIFEWGVLLTMMHVALWSVLVTYSSLVLRPRHMSSDPSRSPVSYFSALCLSLRHCESPSILSSSSQLSLNPPSIGVSFFAPQWHLPTSQLAKSLLVSLPAAFLTPPRTDRLQRPFIPPSPSPPCHHHTKPAFSRRRCRPSPLPQQHPTLHS